MWLSLGPHPSGAAFVFLVMCAKELKGRVPWKRLHTGLTGQPSQRDVLICCSLAPSQPPAKKPSGGTPNQKTMAKLLSTLASFWVPPSLGTGLWKAGGGHILHSLKCDTFLAIQRQPRVAPSWLLLQFLPDRKPAPLSASEFAYFLDFWWTA